MKYDQYDPPRMKSDSTPSWGDDEHYEYYWNLLGFEVRIPHWLAEMIDVPLAVRWELFLIGLCAGLVLAALAVIIGFYSAF